MESTAQLKEKEEVCRHVDLMEADLCALSDRIFAHPELGFEEFTAHAHVRDMVEKGGFTVAPALADLPTALIASYPPRGTGPSIGFIAEYDALPELGHACGHNLIAAASTGAALALAALLQGRSGRVKLFGTPAEEGGGGKVRMLARGAFADVDVVMMVHPFSYTVASRETLGYAVIRAEFRGRSSHAAMAPHEGVNAADAVHLTIVGINFLRQQLRQDVRIHFAAEPSTAPLNVIPEGAALRVQVRATDEAYLQETVKRISRCAEGAGLMTGAQATLNVLQDRRAMRCCSKLANLLTGNLRALGIPPDPNSPVGHLISTDMADVSHVVPCLHGYMKLGEGGVPLHTKAFRELCGSAAGHKFIVGASKALAMTAVDLLTRPDLLREIQEEFRGAGRPSEKGCQLEGKAEA